MNIFLGLLAQASYECRDARRHIVFKALKLRQMSRKNWLIFTGDAYSPKALVRVLLATKSGTLMSGAPKASDKFKDRQFTMLEKSLRELCRALAILGLLGFGAVTAQAQAMAESGTLTSSSAVAAHSAKTASTTTPTPAVQSSSPHLLTRTGPPPSELNRKDFEDNAGENAGRVLFRSVPESAEIFINDLVVGRTPLLLVIAPGKYKVEMRGLRVETGRTTLGVLPKETQTVVISLKQRYPASVSIR